MYPVGFEAFFNVHPDEKYDLIVSNPPFYINSLRSPQKGKEIAKHADSSLFEKMVGAVLEHLRPDGLFCLILPIDTAELVTGLIENNALFVSKTVAIRSFVNYEPHRVILFVASKRMDETADDLIIYQAVNEYSPEYIKLLQPYFITF
jgi:tRNA1Val (adenine37-N6)-methyltransferase